jgi:hypothetical protein
MRNIQYTCVDGETRVECRFLGMILVNVSEQFTNGTYDKKKHNGNVRYILHLEKMVMVATVYTAEPISPPLLK